jgi:hypothetical protein
MNTGDQVQVSYDPGNPAFAREVSASAGPAWWLIELGALAIFAGLASFLLGFRRLLALLNLTSACDSAETVNLSIFAVVAIVISWYVTR